MRAWFFPCYYKLFIIFNHSSIVGHHYALIIFMTKVSVCKALAIGLFSYNICQEIKLLDWSIWMFRIFFFFPKKIKYHTITSKSYQVGQLIASGSLFTKYLILAWKPKTDSARGKHLSDAKEFLEQLHSNLIVAKQICVLPWGWHAGSHIMRIFLDF